MEFYLAPMEGLTTFVYRNTFAKHFGGVTRYFAPFIGSRHMSTRDIRDILPENNENILLIPQILTNKAEDFLAISDTLRSYGYDTVNLNLGCPSGTVVAKHRGAGFLEDPVALDRFLYEIFDKCPMKISIKTRLGMEFLSEWEDLFRIYAKYPLEELIVHPRLQKEYYNGHTHVDAFADAHAFFNEQAVTSPLCYNGDIVSVESYQALLRACPEINHVMIGRGILRNPILPQLLLREASSPSLTKEQLRAFHDDLLDGYCRCLSGGDTPVLYKMKDLWTHLSCCFVSPEKYLKKIRKASRLNEYTIEANRLFREATISEL